jgi:outer membrane protein OmpA-like peptidoglycan-associated protein
MGNENSRRTYAGSVEDLESGSPINETRIKQKGYNENEKTFMEGLKNLNQAIPSIRDNPGTIYLIESHTNCPINQCTPTRCIQIGKAKHRCEVIVINLKQLGCRNTFLLKPWGCQHPTIMSKDFIKVSKVNMSQPVAAPVVEPVRVPTPEPIRVITPEPIRVPTPEPVRVITPEIISEPVIIPVIDPVIEPIRDPIPEPEPIRVTTPEREPERISGKSRNLAAISRGVSAFSVKNEKAKIAEEIKKILEFKDITFAKNSPELDTEGKQVCSEVAEYFREHPEMEINIESHTNCHLNRCNNGCYLQELSQQRVDMVKQEFIALGCHNIFITKGWGCKHPVYGNVRLCRIYPTDDVDDDGNAHHNNNNGILGKTIHAGGHAQNNNGESHSLSRRDASDMRNNNEHGSYKNVKLSPVHRAGKTKAQVKEEIKRFLEAREIQFVKNSPELDNTGKETCQEIANWFIDNPEMEINIESHTNCFTGKCDSECYLKNLSQERTESVKRYLLELGCKNIIFARGWGCKHPKYGSVRLVRIYPTDDVPD